MRTIAQFFALIFIFTIPIENTSVVGEFGSISRLFGVLAGGLWVISVVIQQKIRKLSIFHIFVFSFFLFHVISIYWTVDYDYTYVRLKTYAQMAIQVWMFWDLFSSEKHLHSAFTAFLIGSFIPIIDSYYNFVNSNQISQFQIGRYSGGGQNAVELGLILSLWIPIAFHLGIIQKSSLSGKIIKLISLLFIPLAIVAIILTGSRTAIFTLVPAVIYILISLKNFKFFNRIILSFIIIIILLNTYTFIPTETLERLGTASESISSGDFGGRSILWKKSFDIFQNYPIFGIGSGSLGSPNQLGGFAHNTFISILAELGIIGFILFLCIIFCTIIKILYQPKKYSFLWFTVFSIWMIGIQSLTWEYTKDTWLLLSLIAISNGINWSNEQNSSDQLFSSEIQINHMISQNYLK